MTPHFGSVSTAKIRTLLHSTSSSSATMRAMAVPMCWPISARVMFTVTTPSRSTVYQIVGSKGFDPDSCARPSPGAKPNVTAAPAKPIRKSRRESALGCSSLLIGCNLPRLGSSLFDGVANAHVSHAAAQVAGHDGIDVLIGGREKVVDERHRLHDLTRLAVAALRNLKVGPCFLHRMLVLEPLDGRHLRTGDAGERRYAGARRPAADMDSAGAAHPDAAAELRAGEADDVADHPQEGGVILLVDRHRATIDMERGHVDLRSDQSVA